MLDLHERLLHSDAPAWFGIPVYTIFVVTGIILGLAFYFHELQQSRITSEGAVIIVISSLVCGAIGSKIPLLLEGHPWEHVLQGKSIVGALLGGMTGTLLIKRMLGIKLKLGNIIAPCAALGIAVGRVGCFLNGCCYGIEAPWGFDFGDGLLRLPTQLFESAFHLLAFLILRHYMYKVQRGGLLFKLYLLAYFIFRFLSEFIRVHPVFWLCMTTYQLLCLLGILFVGAQFGYERIMYERRQQGADTSA